MAAVLGVAQADIQRAESAGRNLEKQFTLVLKLLPLADELHIDLDPEPAPVLTAEEIVNDAIGNGKTPGKAAAKRKKGSAPTSISSISSIRNSRGAHPKRESLHK